MSKIIKLGQYKGIEVTCPKQVVTDEEVNTQIEQIVASKETYVAKEGNVEMGDMTTIDFEGFKDGVAFEGGKGENYRLGIGSGTFIPGFEEQMVGMAVNETKDLNVKFPENYGAADLAGAEVIFKVTVHAIETRVQNELNDAFVESLEIPGVHTVEDFRKSVHLNLTAQKEEMSAQQFENMVLDALMNDSEVEVTEEETNVAIDQQIGLMSQQLMQSGLQLEQYLQMMGSNLETLKQQIKPNAQKQAAFEAVITEIIRLEGIETTDEEAQKEIEVIAENNQVTVEQVLEQISTEMIKLNCNRMKAVSVILDSAKNNA